MTISVQSKGNINSKHASLEWKKNMFDGHLGCHLVLGVMSKDASLVSIGFQYTFLLHKNAILHVILFCMQLPTNASLAFFGFIMYYPLLDGHVGFWKSPSFIHFVYSLLSELRKYAFLCILAVKCYFLNKLLYIFIHFWNFTQFYRFSAAILDLAAILNLFTVKMVHYN